MKTRTTAPSRAGVIVAGLALVLLLAVWFFAPSDTPSVATNAPAQVRAVPPAEPSTPMPGASLAPASPPAGNVPSGPVTVMPPQRPPVQLDDPIRLPVNSYPANQNPHPAPASR